MKKSGITRRTFLAGTVAAATGCATARRRAPGIISTRTPNELIHVAGIGCGGKGESDLTLSEKAGARIVALCDVDDERAAHAYDWYPDAPRYKDFREMLDKEKSIDAVTVATPDHVHAVATMYAMAAGKHVYVQKPATHSIAEARALLEGSRKYRVATQMGNQGHAADGVREICEIIRDGAIGDVREVHAWTNRPIWPQGNAISQPLPAQPVPDYLDWDLWLGPAPERPYNEGYCPFKWRGWWDFGCGALGDMGCHILDPPFWALQLGAPSSVECVYQEENNAQSGPVKSIVEYKFPRRKAEGRRFPPVTLRWYEGGCVPEEASILPEEYVKAGGALFVGRKGMLATGSYGIGTRLYPDELNNDYQRPEPSIPRVGDSYIDWLIACKGGRPACSNFEYSIPLTEMVLLGNVALRSGKRIKWDAENMRVTNAPEANEYVGRAYRDGWTLDV